MNKVCIILYLKASVTKAVLGNFKMDTLHDSVLGGMSVNILTKSFCPPMCILFVCSESL